MKKQGGFTFKLEALPVVKELSALAKKSELVEFRTVRDMRRRIPGTVSEGVCNVYQIKKSEVVSIASSKGRGRNSGKGSVSASIRGETIQSLTVTFRGKVHSNWPVLPKSPNRKRKVGDKTVMRRRNQYKVKITVFQKRPVTITPSDGHRVFVVAGRNKAFIVGKDNKPMVKASTSVPQAIRSKDAMDLWVPALNDKLETIFYGHFNRIMKK